MANKLRRFQPLLPLDIAQDALNDLTFSPLAWRDDGVQNPKPLFASKQVAQQKGRQDAENANSTQKILDRPCSDEEAATYASLLRRCGNLKALSQGKRVHALIFKNGHMRETFLGNLLVQMYGKCGAMENAVSVFAEMPRRNVFSWNLLIGAYILNGHGIEALPLYQQMQQQGVMADKVTFVSILSACVSQVALVEGKWIHVCILSGGFESDVVVGTALLNMYGKCASVNNAERMFDSILMKNVITWNAMFAVYTEHGQDTEALQLFQHMELKGVVPNKVTFIILLPACTSQRKLVHGKRMHVRILHDNFESDVVLDNALISMYGKCGALEFACLVFSTMPQRDVVSWNILVEAYLQRGHSKEALYLFQHMQREGILPDDITYISVLSACVNEAALAEGKQLHSRVVSCGFESNVVVGTALVNMYAKCGILEDAWRTFYRMPIRNVVSWNAMIAAYAQHGESDVVLQLFQQMHSEEVVPTDFTFFSVLSACSHTGLMDEGCHWFYSMTRDHGITPRVEHFNCMVDLYGRAGQLDEAEWLIKNMPCKPSAASWSALLSACRMHLDIERGRDILDNVIKLDPESAAPYVSLSNIYAAAGRWYDAARVREMMKRLKKQSRPFIIEDDFEAYEFDSWQLQKEEMCIELQRWSEEIEAVGLPEIHMARCSE